jgi:hypothetical protein
VNFLGAAKAWCHHAGWEQVDIGVLGDTRQRIPPGLNQSIRSEQHRARQVVPPAQG